MPIFMKVEGVKGNLSRNGNGGVWKTTNFLAGGTTNRKGGNGALINSSGSNTWGGINVALCDLDSASPNNVIEVSRISLSGTPAYSIVIDGRDANAVVKARMMFDAQRSGGTFILTFQGQVTGAANNIRGLNNLKQLGLSGRTIPLIGIVISNGGNSSQLEIELQNCLVSSYSVSGSPSAGNGRPMESLSLNFTKITYSN